MHLASSQQDTTRVLVRLSLWSSPSWLEILRDLAIGPATRSARCPLRQTIVGDYRPNDSARIATLILLASAMSTLMVLAIKNHSSWMYLIELIISICT